MQRPKPTAQWSKEDLRQAERAIDRVLRGVGREIAVREIARITLQVRRLVTAEEQAVVGPAIDARTP